MHVWFILPFISLFIIQTYSIDANSLSDVNNRLVKKLFIDETSNVQSKKELAKTSDKLPEEKAETKKIVEAKKDSSKETSKNSTTKGKLKETAADSSKDKKENDKNIKSELASSNETIESKDETNNYLTRSREIDVSSIRPEFEKYYAIDKQRFDEMCSNELITKSNQSSSQSQSLHTSGKHFILTLDNYNLSYKFELNKANKYYPKLTKIPYRCTSYCELKKKSNKTDFAVNRFKYNNYLIEFVDVKDYGLVKFYLENSKYLDDESDQAKHLIEVLTFTIENDGCTSPITNPALRDNYVDNLVTKDLIKTFCNKQLRQQFKENHEFLIQEQDGQDDSIFKKRFLIFFNYPVATEFNITTNEIASKDNELQKNNLANPIKDIKNAVQIKYNDKGELDDENERFVVFTNQQMHILQKQETQFIELPSVYSLQSFFNCPAPLCLDPYFDDVFIVKSCDFDLLFDFLPRASRLMFAFRGNYFYLVNIDGKQAPKIEQAIPIDYLFKGILQKSNINFNYIDAAEYVKKSDVIIIFKEDKYVLIDPLNKIVNGPFVTSETFKYNSNSPETVFMDGDDLVMINKGSILKYKWSAPILTGKRDISLVEYITLSEIHDPAATAETEKSNGAEALAETEKPISAEATVEMKIDAAFKDNDTYFLFVGDNLIEINYDKDFNKKIDIKDVASKFFSNCKSTPSKSKKKPNLEAMYDFIKTKPEINAITDKNSTQQSAAKNLAARENEQVVPNSSSYLSLNFTVQFISFILVFVNFCLRFE